MKTTKIIVVILSIVFFVMLGFSGCATKSKAVTEKVPKTEKAEKKEKKKKKEEKIAKVEEEAMPEPQIEVVIRDSDGDGVNDDQDRCPDTPPGMKVDASGCPEYIGETVSIQITLEFDFDSAVIRQSYYDQRYKIFDFMEQNPEAELEEIIVEGHADNTGRKSYNYRLSRRRAEAVKRLLMAELNVGPEYFTVRAFGEDRPIATNKTREGRQRNRRVDISFRVKNVRM